MGNENNAYKNQYYIKNKRISFTAAAVNEILFCCDGNAVM
jgi:hypothetical protein